MSIIKKLRIGLTYDLRTDYLADGFSDEETAELDSEITIAAISGALTAAGHTVERIGGIKALTRLLSGGLRWDIVFNIAEGFYGGSREAQVPALLDAYNIPYTFSQPLTLCAALDKPTAKRLVRDHGINTAGFCVINEPEDISLIDFPFPVFCKPVGEGSSKGVGEYSFVEQPEKLGGTVAALLKKFNQPVLVEEYLPGREYTVGIVGTGKEARALGVMEVRLNKSSSEGYSYENKIGYLEKITYRLACDHDAAECGDLALKVWNALSCRDGGRVDIKYDRFGKPSFIEVNPLAGLNPEYSDLPILCGLAGVSYNKLIEEIIDSAILRLK